MAERREDPLLAYARELEEADRALGRATAEVAELQRAIDDLVGRGREIELFLSGLPGRREAAGAGVASAEDELDRRLEELREAEADLTATEGRRSEEALVAARRAVVRARDAVASAERRLDRARDARAQLDHETARAESEVPELERRARTLAERLRTLPRIARDAAEPPQPGLAATLAWGARAAAALFVARGGLDSERERVVREANELGASALGEPLFATSVALVRERLERR
jgi:chromosome segregation ATPase